MDGYRGTDLCPDLLDGCTGVAAMMKDDTPYRERPAKEVAAEVDCMRTIFAKAQSVDIIFEAFGGTGMTAEVMKARFPDAKIWATDLDHDCVVAYNKKQVGFAICGDARDGLNIGLANGLAQRNWGASLDFNRFTILDLERKEGEWKRDLIRAVVNKRPKWIQITDSAVCYLATNYKRYGLLDKELSSYVNKLSCQLGLAFNLDLITYANHRAATYLLYHVSDNWPG